MSFLYACAGKPYTRWSNEERSIVVEYFSDWVHGKHEKGLPGKNKCLANAVIHNHLQQAP